jgi:hypothetical protein
MTDTPTPTKTRKPVRKGAPPMPTETLGALTAPAENAPATPPKAAKPARAKPAPKAAASKPVQKVKAAEAEAPKHARKPASERTKPLNFRVTNEFRKAFKQAATTEDCKKVELLERMFDAWKATRS